LHPNHIGKYKMKNLFITFITILLFIACNNESKNKEYVSLAGTITNPQDSTISINSRSFNKKIKINIDGTFKDTLAVEEGFFLLSNGTSQSVIHLRNTYNLDILFDAEDMPNTITFSGLGADMNNYISDKIKFEQEFELNNTQQLFELEKLKFDKKVNTIKDKMSYMLNKYTALDSAFYNNEIAGSERFIEFLTSNYDELHAIYAPIAKGKPSPKFSYPDVNGKYVSLDQFKGNYVYIDIWATWCQPCLAQIPFLKELEEEFNNKNITFLSLSVDKQIDKEKWRNMVLEKNLSGIQVMADQDLNSEFVAKFNINGIPRFLLIDPKGNIVSNDAPRPSDPQLRELFKKLSI